MSDRVECPGCGKDLARLKSGRYKNHKLPNHQNHRDSRDYCDYGGTVIPPEDNECQNESSPSATTTPASSAESSTDDAAPGATSATSSIESSPNSPEPAAGASTASAPDALPGANEYAKKLGDLAAEQLEAYKRNILAAVTVAPFSQPSVPDRWEEDNTLFSQPLACDCEEVYGKITCQGTCPQSVGTTPFSQPAGRKSEAPAKPMTDLGRELTARLKEIFYAYDNRRSEDNRSAQTTMGPSEMGTPCDRRLALSLMRMPPVNPGGDGWAAFVGTCIHAGLERMFLWASGDTGRFAVEQRLEFGHVIVPKGTADLIDRTLFLILDHKCQGRWSRNKLKSQGPSKTYRVQAHVYAKGARLRGERIENIAIVSWPRDEATLDDLYVFTEPYNPKIADDAFARVDDIDAEVGRRQAEVREIYPDAEDLEVNARVGASFVIAEDCRFCPFYLPNSSDPLRGCNGKR